MSNPYYNSQNNGEQDNNQQSHNYTSQPHFSNGYATPNQISDEPISFAPQTQSYGSQGYGNQHYGNQGYPGYNNYSSPNPEAGKKLSTVALVFSLVPAIFFIAIIFSVIVGASAIQAASDTGVENLTGGMLLFFVLVGLFGAVVCPASLITSLTLSIVGLSKGYQYKGKLTAALVITIISIVLGLFFIGIS